MFCLFLESNELTPEIYSLQELNSTVNSMKEEAIFIISYDVARFIRESCYMDLTIKNLKNCRFSLDNGNEFFRFDHNGTCEYFCKPEPYWHVPPEQFIQSQWQVNHELHGLITPEFLTVYRKMFPCPQKKQEQFNLLFQTEIASGADLHVRNE